MTSSCILISRHDHVLSFISIYSIYIYICIYICKGIVVHAMKAYRGSSTLAPLILNLEARWRCVVTSKAGRFFAAKDHRFPLNRRFGSGVCLDLVLEERKSSFLARIRTSALPSRNLVAILINQKSLM